MGLCRAARATQESPAPAVHAPSARQSARAVRSCFQIPRAGRGRRRCCNKRQGSSFAKQAQQSYTSGPPQNAARGDARGRRVPFGSRTFQAVRSDCSRAQSRCGGACHGGVGAAPRRVLPIAHSSSLPLPQPKTRQQQTSTPRALQPFVRRCLVIQMERRRPFNHRSFGEKFWQRARGLAERRQQHAETQSSSPSAADARAPSAAAPGVGDIGEATRCGRRR